MSDKKRHNPEERACQINANSLLHRLIKTEDIRKEFKNIIDEQVKDN